MKKERVQQNNQRFSADRSQDFLSPSVLFVCSVGKVRYQSEHLENRRAYTGFLPTSGAIASRTQMLRNRVGLP